MEIKRTFQEIPEGHLEEADQQSFLVGLGWSNAVGWTELLQSKRVLLISEAGAGKTYECRTQCRRLWDAGEPAFFLELATLAKNEFRSMLDVEEESRLDRWRSSQSEIATFFLDSIDELKLTLGSFELAIKRLAKIFASQLGRARIIITTRPVPFDKEIVRRLLPVPLEVEESEVSGEAFAEHVLEGGTKKHPQDTPGVHDDWRTVALMPLSDEQILSFSRGQGVDAPDVLLDDMQRRNAQEFARRPQDLIELCADWRNSKRIRTHREQVESNVRIKLKPREDRREPTELSVDSAIEGASRLALAMMVTRQLTIRHSAEADSGGSDAALDPEKILSDWNPNQRKALLERPLFGFASYGRVRFHHRSILEYLAAARITTLRKRGMTVRALSRLIFAKTRGTTIVRPSKRPLAGWLALTETSVFETLRDNEPAVLLTEGDPESLPLSKRFEVLRAYVKRYGKGGWRGMSVPKVQVHRFTSSELAPEISRLWNEGIENSEIRLLLLRLIELGRITECADIAYAVAIDGDRHSAERLTAIDALAGFQDPRLKAIADRISADPKIWPDKIASGAVIRLFPTQLSVVTLSAILARIKESEDEVGGLSWHLPRIIAESDLDSSKLEDLRDNLVRLISSGLRWREDWLPLVSERRYLHNSLAATCLRGLKTSSTESWMKATAIALHIFDRDRVHDDAFKNLDKAVAELTSQQSANLFWAEDSLFESLHSVADPSDRAYRVAFNRVGSQRIDIDRDGGWIRAELASDLRSLPERAMLLEIAIRISPDDISYRDYLLGLKPLIVGSPELTAVLEKFLAPPEENQKQKQRTIQSEKRKAKWARKEAKNRESWVSFWKEVTKHPESAFSSEQSENTAWNLWLAMRKSGDESRGSAWNRLFLEHYFDKNTADRLRSVLMSVWRKERPLPRSERPEDSKNTYLWIWLIGLAGVYAESEDTDWVARLSSEEAELAARYALMEFNGLPIWLEPLVASYPIPVKAVIGREILSDLNRKVETDGHSILIQDLGNSSDLVAQTFVPEIRSWFGSYNYSREENEVGAAQRLKQVIDFLFKHGDADVRGQIHDVSQERVLQNLPTTLARIWLRVLMRHDPESAVSVLESRINSIQPESNSEAVKWIASVFGSRSDGFSLSDSHFTPPLLLRILDLVYRHVCPEDDVNHEGAYSPNERDDAESVRHRVVNALLKSTGVEGWKAKLRMAANPNCKHFKDRIIAVAEETWAEEIDANALSDNDAVALDRTGEAPPSSNESMFALMVDRLDELDDLLLGDTSPREVWASIDDEKVMRREISRELRYHSSGLYTVDQEAVTGDEKETDIRLRSTTSNHEAVIELKLADRRSFANLFDALDNQLVTKYLAPESCRSGCLLLTLSKDRKWSLPGNRKRIGFEELVSILEREATNIAEKLGGCVHLHVHGLDLRPRLPKEAPQGRIK